MNYEQTIDYLFTRLPLFSRIGAAAYKPNLDNTIRLCESLDNPAYKIQICSYRRYQWQRIGQSHAGGYPANGRIQNRALYLAAFKRFQGKNKSKW